MNPISITRKNKTHPGYLINSIFWVILLLCAQCKQKKDDPVPAPENENKYKLTSQQFVPLQAVGVTFVKPQNLADITATIGSATIVLKPINDTLFSFLSPEALSPGKYDLKITNNRQITEVTINPPNTISNPAEYYREFNEQTNEQLQKFITAQKQLIELGLATPEESNKLFDEIQRQLSNGAETFFSASKEEQKRAAQFISANRGALDSLSAVLSEIQLAEKSGRITTPCEPRPYGTYCRCMARQILVTGSILAVSLKLMFVIPDPFLKVAVGGVVFLAMKEFQAILSNNLRLPSIYDGGEPERLNLRTSGNNYLDGVASSMQFKIPIRSFQPELDKNSPIEEFKKLSTMLEEMKSWAKILGNLFTIDILDNGIAKGYTYPDESSKLKVDIINNTNIKANTSNFKNQTFEITFTTSEKSDQNFDFKITYNYNGSDVSKVYTGATLKSGKIPLTIVGAASEPIKSIGETYTSYEFSVKSENWQPSEKTVFTWDMGDGSEKKTVTGISKISHYYKTAGKFNITVTAMDGLEPIGIATEQCEIQFRSRTLYTKVYFTANGKEYKSEKNGDYFLSTRDKIYAIGGWTDGTKVGDICNIDFLIPHSKFKGVGTYDLKTDVDTHLSIREEKMCHGVYTSFRSPNVNGTLVITSYENNIIEATFEFVISPLPRTIYDDHEHTEVISVKDGKIVGQMTNLDR